MNLSDLRTEVKARGFNHVDSSRIDRWINLAYLRLCDREAWPFLETTTSGTAPLTITDFRAALSVRDTTNECVLAYEDLRNILDEDPSLEATGNPERWYLDSTTSLAVYPPNTTPTISVRYLKVPAELDEDTDVPVIPTRYHYLLADWAVALANRDSDNYEAAGYLMQEVEEGIASMRNGILVPNFDSTLSIVQSDRWAW